MSGRCGCGGCRRAGSSRGGKPKKEWMVWPPTLTAARPGGRQHHHLVGEQLLEAGQQRRLAGAGAPGDEQMAVALLQEILGGLVLARRRDAGRPATGVGRAGNGSGCAVGHLMGPVPERANCADYRRLAGRRKAQCHPGPAVAVLSSSKDGPRLTSRGSTSSPRCWRAVARYATFPRDGVSATACGRPRRTGGPPRRRSRRRRARPARARRCVRASVAAGARRQVLVDGLVAESRAADRSRRARPPAARHALVGIAEIAEVARTRRAGAHAGGMRSSSGRWSL